MEWNGPIGEVEECGGDVLFRSGVFLELGGFNPRMIAGEEPELCVRVRGAGYKVLRLGDPMAVHDAAITRFAQWWKRMVRGGYAFAQATTLHSPGGERHGVRESGSIWFWGAALPLVAIAGAVTTHGWSLALLLAYPLQVVRVALRQGGGRRDWWHATFLMIGKFAELAGQVTFFLRRGRGSRARLIEYK